MQYYVVVPKRLCQTTRQTLTKLGVLDTKVHFETDDPREIGLPINRKINALDLKNELGAEAVETDNICIIHKTSAEVETMGKRKTHRRPIDELRSQLQQVV